MSKELLVTDFSNYELGQNVFALADGLLPEIASTAGYDLGQQPDEIAIRGLIELLGPQKELQMNIQGVKDTLGEDSANIAADWVERSGVLEPIERPFASPGTIPDKIDAIVWAGNVANWALRQTTLTERFDPAKVGVVWLPAGNRVMRESEHQLVKTYARTEGNLPTEYQFIGRFVIPRLERAGFNVNNVRVDSKKGKEVLDGLIHQHDCLVQGTVLSVSSAPNGIQAAGQLRLAAKRANIGFDADGQQLFMISDTIPVARKGEGTATHQNPFTALGQIVRNALYLHNNQPQ